MHGLTKEEAKTLARLSTPRKIQDFLDTLPINRERGGATNMSPRRVLREKKAHCMEGAMLAAAALWLSGERPLLMDLRSVASDDDHVVALYRVNGLWGAISKTNHAALRFRDPVYRSVRELALSYFHEYFVNGSGKKTLREHSGPFDLSRFGDSWVTAEEDLWDLAEAIDDAPHHPLFPPGQARYLRPADRIEQKAGRIVEWP